MTAVRPCPCSRPARSASSTTPATAACSMVASDRISAFDVVMAEPIPDKGRVLTAMTALGWRSWPTWRPTTWSAPTRPTSRTGRPPCPAASTTWPAGRCWCDRAEMLAIECIVRGYLAGSAYKEYRAGGHRPRHAHARRAAARPGRCPSRSSPRRPRPPRDTTSTSAWPRPSTWSARRRPRPPPSCAWPPTRRAAARAEQQGIVICDTKFELGIHRRPAVALRRGAHPGLVPVLAGRRLGPGHQPAVVRQAAAARLARGPAVGQAPPPPAAAADEIVEATSTRYVDAYERVCGRSLADWYGA